MRFVSTFRATSTVAFCVMLVSGAARSQPAHAAARAGTPAPAVCVAIMLPNVQGVEGHATDVATIVRDLFSSFLTGPSLKPLVLEARLPALAIEEAKQKDCGNVLLATLTRKRGGGLGKALGQAAGAASWYLPYGGTTAAAVTRSATVATAQAVSSLATTTRAKDEMQLDYRVVGPNNAVRLPAATEKAKAKSDGEDLLTPIVQRAAEAIATAVMK